MSFGFGSSVGDAIQVLTLLKEEYGKWQAAPELYKDLIREVKLLQFSLEAFQGTINIEHPQWTTLLAEWKELLSDAETFTEKHGGLGTSARDLRLGTETRAWRFEPSTPDLPEDVQVIICGISWRLISLSRTNHSQPAHRRRSNTERSK